MVNTIATHRKVNAILLNCQINQQKLADICGYKLATKWPNFTETYLA